MVFAKVHGPSGGVTPPWWVWFTVPLVIVTVAAVFYLDYRRRERIKAFAASQGMQYAATDNKWAKLDLGWPSGEGHSHKAKNVLTGTHNGRPIVVFDHKWATGSGKERQTHTARVTAVRIPRTLSKVFVRQEGMFGRAARRLGIKDIELESDQFNERYHVAGDRRLAYDVLSPRFMEWMLQNQHEGFAISGDYVVYAVYGHIELEHIDREIAYLDAIIERLPRYVISG